MNPVLCSAPSCLRAVKVKCAGLCGKHYQRMRAGKSLDDKSFVCSYGDCGRRHVAFGLCEYHYRRQKKGLPLEAEAKTETSCGTEGCDKPAKTSGMCAKHYRRAYYLANQERAKAKALDSYRANPDVVKQRSKEWLRAHPECRDVCKHRRRARVSGAGGSFTKDEWSAVLEAFGHRCLHCARHVSETKLTIDHIIPVSKGGCSNIWNLQPLCLSCNSKKGARL